MPRRGRVGGRLRELLTQQEQRQCDELLHARIEQHVRELRYLHRHELVEAPDEQLERACQLCALGVTDRNTPDEKLVCSELERAARRV